MFTQSYLVFQKLHSGMILMEMKAYVHTKSCARMFTTAPFASAKRRNNEVSPTANGHMGGPSTQRTVAQLCKEGGPDTYHNTDDA